jgi:ketosteroid isomerase-like protein
MPVVDKNAEKKAIRDLDAKWSTAASRRDLKAVIKFYGPHRSLVWPGAPVVRGTKKVRKALSEFLNELKKTPKVEVRFIPERIHVSDAGDMALDFGRMEVGQRAGDVFKYLVIWQKVKGTWKVLYDSYNSNR